MLEEQKTNSFNAAVFWAPMLPKQSSTIVAGLEPAFVCAKSDPQDLLSLSRLFVFLRQKCKIDPVRTRTYNLLFVVRRVVHCATGP
jgi:hypothetical protein